MSDRRHEIAGRRAVNSSVHENGSGRRGRNTPAARLEAFRATEAHVRRDLIEWACRSRSRLKTLHAVASRRSIGLVYDDLQTALGVSRRWTKELLGELREMDVIQTPGNPATARPASRRLYLLICDVLTTLLPSEKQKGGPDGSPLDGGGQPPSGGTPPSGSGCPPRGQAWPPP